MKKTSFRKKILIGVSIAFLILNAIAAFHAYQFTHFSTVKKSKTNPNQLSLSEKLKVLFLGIDNPRPENTRLPSQAYETIPIKSNKKIEGWYIPCKNAKGTFVLFHGYGGCKSTMLDKGEEFLRLGYSVLLIDFMGSGGSEGNQTTIGYYEAEQVKSCYEFLKKRGEKNIYLFGTSLGAVAITKAIHDHALNPSGIILECPFGSMYKTTAARFRSMKIPAFPMANLLVFWGGIENNFWAYGHNPTEYAKTLSCPLLLMYGEKDDRVTRAEIDEIFMNVKVKKQLVLFTEAGHENYLIRYKTEWKDAVSKFLGETHLSNKDS